MNNLLTKFFTKNIFSFVEPNIEKIKDSDIAIIDVKKSDKPVFIKNGNDKMFLIRGSASVQKLDLEETAGYIKSNWN